MEKATGWRTLKTRKVEQGKYRYLPHWELPDSPSKPETNQSSRGIGTTLDEALWDSSLQSNNPPT